MVRAKTYEEGVQLVNDHEYGNGTAIFTRDGDCARTFVNRVQAGAFRDAFVAAGGKLGYFEVLPTSGTVDRAIAGRVAAVAPDVVFYAGDYAPAATLKRALLDAKTIGTSGEGSSGRYVASLIERLGIADQVKPKIRSGGAGRRSISASSWRVTMLHDSLAASKTITNQRVTFASMVFGSANASRTTPSTNTVSTDNGKCGPCCSVAPRGNTATARAGSRRAPHSCCQCACWAPRPMGRKTSSCQKPPAAWSRSAGRRTGTAISAASRGCSRATRKSPARPGPPSPSTAA